MKKKEFNLSCPIPVSNFPNIVLAHGGGGKLMHRLIEDVFMPAFKNPYLEARHDGAVIQLQNCKIAFTTDSYVVQPLFFPGGDIGMLAVNGTVNDLAMCGARPLYLSAGVILEEGFPMDVLQLIVQSMKNAAETAQVQFVTGDTKVVDKGKGDGIFINTAGIGIIEHNMIISPKSVQPGDIVLLNGDIGRHGIAIMAVREGLEFESKILSDSMAVSGLILKLLEEKIEVHCMRDLTRGGLASAVVEIAESSKVQIDLEENSIPVCEEVHGACEILGFDPLYVANEGRFVAFVVSKDAQRALEIMRSHPCGKGSSIIGQVKDKSSSLVTLKSQIGVSRVVDMLSGEQLPRIC